MARFLFPLWLATVSFLLQQVTASENLLVFVGEKISVEEFQPVVGAGEVLMDAASLRAKYPILRSALRIDAAVLASDDLAAQADELFAGDINGEK